jgi:hypothetical protein
MNYPGEFVGKGHSRPYAVVADTAVTFAASLALFSPASLSLLLNRVGLMPESQTLQEIAIYCRLMVDFIWEWRADLVGTAILAN